MNNHFYTLLPSNSCPTIHPNNTAGKFTVDFQNPIYLDSNWEVALMDFTFKFNTFPIYSHTKIEFVDATLQTREFPVFIDNKQKQLFVNDFGVEVLNGNSILILRKTFTDFEMEFDTIETAARFGFPNLNNSLDNGDSIITCREFKNDNSIEQHIFKLKYSLENTVVLYFYDEIYIKNLQEFDDFIKHNFGNLFSSYSLQKDAPFQFELESHIKSIKFDEILTETLGLDRQLFVQSNLNLPHKEIFKAIKNPKLIINPHQLFIYSNIVEPVIVGDVNVPLLKSIWLETYEEDEIVQIIVKNPMYLPVATTCINNIEINIRDDIGKLINFAKDAKTHLTLHFRKVNE